MIGGLTRRRVCGGGAAGGLLGTAAGFGLVPAFADPDVAAWPAASAPAAGASAVAAAAPAAPTATAASEASAASAPAAPQRLTPAQLREDASLLQRALQTLHPGLYRYRTPAEMSGAYAAMVRGFMAARDRDDAGLAAQRLAAFIRCGHTWANPLNQAPALIAERDLRADVLPFRLRLVERRYMVSASVYPGIFRGDEILALDGKPVRGWTEALWPYLRADGACDSKRLVQIGDEGGEEGDPNAFDLYFHDLFPPRDGVWTLTVRNTDAAPPREFKVAPVRRSERNAQLKAAGQGYPALGWSMRVDGGVAVMTLPTFAFWRNPFDWRRWLALSFGDLKEQGAQKLIIDIRANEGGDGAIGEQIVRHLARQAVQPEPYDARVAADTVPLDIAQQLDTWDRRFLQRQGQVEPAPTATDPRLMRFIAGGPADAMADHDPAPLEPMPGAFTGRTALLTGPVCSSATHVLARTLKDAGLARLFGRPTGGNLRGLNGGQLAWLVLPHSGVAIDIPLVAWMPRRPMPDSPVLPDVTVTPTVNAWRIGRDEEMDAALRWLNG